MTAKSARAPVPIVDGGDELERLTEATHRLAAVGRLSATLLHELTNLVGSAQLGVDMLALRQRRLGETGAVAPENAEQLDQLLRSCQCALANASRLCRAGVELSGHRDQARPVDPNAEVRDACTVAMPYCAGRAELRVACEPLPTVETCPGQICLLVVNLVLNAVDSIEEARAACPQSPALGVVSVHTSQDGQSVLIAVEDSGCGIAAEHRERIFEPFYTTKPPGEGTGLGLAAVREVVTRLGGSVRVTSTVGLGSRFEVRLPLAPKR